MNMKSMIYHSSIIVRKKTRYKAIKEAVDLMIDRFQNEANIFIRCRVFFDEGEIDFIARREVMKIVMGLEYSKINLSVLKNILPKDKWEYENVFNSLLKNRADEDLQDKNKRNR